MFTVPDTGCVAGKLVTLTYTGWVKSFSLPAASCILIGKLGVVKIPLVPTSSKCTCTGSSGEEFTVTVPGIVTGPVIITSPVIPVRTYTSPEVSSNANA